MTTESHADATRFDVCVVGGDLGGLAAAVELAGRGRSVVVVGGDTSPALASLSGRLPAQAAGVLAPLIDQAPGITDRQALVLTPEGSLGASFTSQRLTEAGHRRVLVDQAELGEKLSRRAQDLGAIRIERGLPTIRFTEGRIAGIAVGAQLVSARCTLFADGPRSLPAMSAGLLPAPSSRDADLVTEWRLAADPAVARERMRLGGDDASEWWLFGDPLRGSGGRASLLVGPQQAALSLVAPLREVRHGLLVVTTVMQRLLEHPAVRSITGDASVAAVTGHLRPRQEAMGCRVGDGFVHLSNGSASLVDPTSWGLETGLAAAEVIDQALGPTAVTAARLLPIPSAIREITRRHATLPAGPIDAWGDELLTAPERLVDAARSLAERFADAG